jgi:hypothetical protein
MRQPTQLRAVVTDAAAIAWPARADGNGVPTADSASAPVTAATPTRRTRAPGADERGGVWGSLRRSGRKTQVRFYDALIAATAVAHDLPVFTRNPDDFERVDGVTVHTV